MPQYIDCGWSFVSLISVAEMCTTKIGQVESATSSLSNESIMEIYNHADTTALGSNCLPVYSFEISVDVSGWDARAGNVLCHNTSGAIAECRNLLSIESRLNRIDPSTNIIFLPNAEHGYRTKFEIILGGVFQYSID